MSTPAVTLYRPVGKKELDLIEASSFKRFPPRLPGQPIFYPVLNAEYASQIARDWNSKDAAHNFTGYVLEFAVETSFLSRYATHIVGGRVHEEYWIPAEDLGDFNDHIVGLIRTMKCFRNGHEIDAPT